MNQLAQFSLIETENGTAKAIISGTGRDLIKGAKIT